MSISINFRLPTLAALSDVYRCWIIRNDLQALNLGSADEHLSDARLTDEQRAFLAYFCERWDESAAAVQKVTS